jgi:hypothetical protein
VRHVLEHEMVDALVEEVEKWEREEAEKGTLKQEKSLGGRVHLPLVK